MNIVLSNYFNEKPDPQSGKFINPGEPARIAPWAITLKMLGLNGVILTDHKLPAITDAVKYVRYDLTTDWSCNDERFLAWLKYLEKNKNIKNVFLTDLFDVDFFKNPFDLISNKHDVYVGCGAGFDKKINQNKWLIKKMFGAYQEVKHENKRTLNAGVLGGNRKTIIKVLRFMVDEFKKIDSEYNYNMAVFNNAIYSLIPENRVMVGPPLVSRFKRYQKSGDFAIRHK